MIFIIIIETCPRCGHDLRDLVIATYPPIPKKECWNCGWSWTGKPEEVVRMSFGGNSLNVTNTTEYLNKINLEDFVLNDLRDNTIIQDVVNDIKNNVCESCSTNPKNGGNGICGCILGQHAIY